MHACLIDRGGLGSEPVSAAKPKASLEEQAQSRGRQVASPLCTPWLGGSFSLLHRPPQRTDCKLQQGCSYHSAKICSPCFSGCSFGFWCLLFGMQLVRKLLACLSGVEKANASTLKHAGNMSVLMRSSQKPGRFRMACRLPSLV